MIVGAPLGFETWRDRFRQSPASNGYVPPPSPLSAGAWLRPYAQRRLALLIWWDSFEPVVSLEGGHREAYVAIEDDRRLSALEDGPWHLRVEALDGADPVLTLYGYFGEWGRRGEPSERFRSADGGMDSPLRELADLARLGGSYVRCTAYEQGMRYGTLDLAAPFVGRLSNGRDGEIVVWAPGDLAPSPLAALLADRLNPDWLATVVFEVLR